MVIADLEADSRARPWPQRELAWRFLTGEERLIRVVEALDIYSTRRGRQTIEIDVALPADAEAEDWLIPAAYLEKRPIAPDLEVRDESGAMIAVPTKHENQELTLAALTQLHAAGALDLDQHPQLRMILGDIVCRLPLVAEAAEVQLLERIAPSGLLERLVEQLRDQFLLWVPLSGPPGSTHHFSIQRRRHRWERPVFPRILERRQVTLDMAIGRETFIGPSGTGRRTVNLAEGLERLLRMLGLAPIAFEHDTAEATRPDSYHAIVRAPQDFVVRDVRLARVLEDPGEPGEILLEELDDEPNQTIQGHDSELAHVHCVRRRDETPLSLEVLLAIRNGLTTLWALGVVMTAALLRIFEQDPHPAMEGAHLDVAAAVLLLGPALIAAWAVRSDEGDLLRHVLSGTRQLLMASAMLSVAAALALIGYTPFGWSAQRTIEWYGAAAYLIAVVVVVSWSITRATPWLFYRHLLNSSKRNLIATATTAALAAALALHQGLPGTAVGASLLAIGLILAAISANRIGTAMGGQRRPFAPLAGIAAAAAFLGAGALTGFFPHLPEPSLLRPAVCEVEASIAILAAWKAVQGG